MALGKPRDRRKESLWRRMVRDQARSTESVRAWCSRRELSQATFYWWRAELARRDAACGEPCQVERRTFVPVRVTNDLEEAREAVSEGRIEISLAGGRLVFVHGRVSRAMLADVMSILEERGC